MRPRQGLRSAARRRAMPSGNELNAAALKSHDPQTQKQGWTPGVLGGARDAQRRANSKPYRIITSARPSGGAQVPNLPHRLGGRSVLLAVALQFDHLVLDFDLFLFQPADLKIIGARSGHLFLDPRFQYPVLLRKLREMSGKRHIALRLGVEGTLSVTRK